jgi:membrane-bound lytic murein transglycosylase D
MALIRPIRLALLLSASLATAACVHTPVTHAPNVPAVEPVQAVDLVAPGEAVDASIEAEPAPVADDIPTPYPDLFDRVRSGFKLDDVQEHAVDMQLFWFANHPDYLERSFERSELYLYDIASQIEARGMPQELALLPMIESAYEPYAYSRARALGLWQFIPGTGSRFGLKQDWWYDGRRDVVESTRAALDYLQFLHDELNGDWLLAIAAYNCGELNVERALNYNRAKGRPLDFWSLKLPLETRAYVPKLLAMKRLIADPARYGLAFSKIPNQPRFERVETLGQIDMKLAAELAGINFEDLYELNPAFHRWATDPSGPHFLLLPLDSVALFRQNNVQLTPAERLPATRYRVVAGDSVASVAHRVNTTIAVLREMNDLPEGKLTVGSDLNVPAIVALPPKVARAAALVDRPEPRLRRRGHIHVVRRGDSLWAIAHRQGVNVHKLASLNGMQPDTPLRAGQHLNVAPGSDSEPAPRGEASASLRPVTYTVRSGDTLAQISRLFQVTVAQITRWNGLESASLSPGQKLIIRVLNRHG